MSAKITKPVTVRIGQSSTVKDRVRLATQTATALMNHSRRTKLPIRIEPKKT